MSLGDDELSEAAEKQSHSILGRVQVEAGRNLFPLTIERPTQFASHRVALVGESAHVVPPIGAQGLNMGLRDAADIADIAGNAHLARRRSGLADGAGALSVRPPRRRREPADRDRCRQPLAAQRFPAMQSLRAAGMHLLGSFGPLRRLAMREGLAPTWKRVS